ncbi:glycosyltransferase family 1 protein [Mucilaginibacter sp.]|jgi:glycosyltransferase involved in cell wall biosynthesis|uniref:glycosyltransferase family 4 protein n=1 Tax=Mucilaginibacter sp. TaxID=1882438 RepID=UPI002C329463|nr:glycosyltransferase family 1 protein [Mucilaginibacter sp.]HTI60650.1 glycosyltransferase family 1 protein [Mucilaginibacter sp.]
MRIGYDAKRAFLNRTGLGNYSRWLIRSMVSYYPQNTYFLYTPKIRHQNGLSFPSGFQNVVAVVPRSKFFTSLWRSAGVVKDLKRDQVDLYHGLSHELPRGIDKKGIRSVVTVHDLIFMRFPQYFGAINRLIYSSKLKHACRVADKIVAISKRTKQDLIDLLNIPAEKIEVVYQGCDPIFKKDSSEQEKQAVLKKYDLPAEFILSVGTIEERKNLLQLINALPGLNYDIKLVVVGRQTAYFNKVKRAIDLHHIANRVIFLNSVSFDELPALYQSAKIFVYPSRYEGFGIPVLEALCSGVPVIAATGSCLEEAGGPCSQYAAPDDVNGLAEKLNLVLGDEGLRQKMIAEGREYSANFDDKILAGQMFDIYKNILQNA